MTEEGKHMGLMELTHDWRKTEDGLSYKEWLEERVLDLERQLAESRTKHFEDCGKAKLSGYEEGKLEAERTLNSLAVRVDGY